MHTRFFRPGICMTLLVTATCILPLAGCQPNTSPVVSVEVEKGKVNLSESSRVVCAASDANGDNLTFQWSTSGGELSGSGPTLTWFAPHTPGMFTITVNVSDGQGGEAAAEARIEVVNQLPVLKNLSANPPLVIQGQTSTLDCVAYDPDGDVLQYEWKATGGTLSGQGPVITWTAPESCAQYVVTVKVTDSTGGQQVREVGVNVRKAGG